MPKIFLRANANKLIGMGHLMRLESIEFMINSYFDCVYLLREEDSEAFMFLNNKKVVKIPTQKKHKNESEWIANNILTGNEIVILDGYTFDTDYQLTLRNKSKGLVFIDDIQSFHYVADIVINHALGISADKFSKESYTKLFLGLEYCLLRPTFLRKAKLKKSKSEKGGILISMGGADPENVSQKILNDVSNLFPYFSINLIVGPTNPNYHNLLEQNKKKGNLKISKNLNEEEIAEIMINSSIAILPPSTTALEYLCTGGLLFLYLTASNQEHGYKTLISNEYALPYSEIFKPEILQLKKYKEFNLIDGESPKRIENAIKSLLLC
jgi:UDP-2,4-diacetamido-2,4,6-trideoxy-beta-L-altropyranose hydrolase